jgi:serine/threonine protein kinase
MKLAIADAGSTGDIPQAQFSPGDRIGPYEIASLTGRGGMGEVYRARDTRLDRTVAVKLLSPDVVDGIARRERFEREARAVSSLNHPNICSLYDVGEQDDTPFLVMEYVEGETLAERLVRGALPIEQALRYAIEIVDALDHAHNRGIVHRDLKPANIMLTQAGVKLLDFGVAKLKGRASISGRASAVPQALHTITEDGAVIGTLQYMAPEQLEARDTDQRTDVFAFGAVVYEMATGQPAFGGSDRASVMAAILGHDPSPCSVVRRETPPLLDEIVTRCLAKSPADRWQTANDLKQALARVTDARARIDGRASSWSPRRMPRGWVAAAAIAVLTSLTVMAVIVASRSVPTDTRPFRFIVPPPANANFNQSSAFMAVSPDGHSLAFVASSRDGNDALWIRSLDSLDARQLPGTDGGAQPFWSSDSRFLAFGVVGAMDTLRKLNVASGSSQAISGSRAAPGAWNDEGVILFPGGRERGGVLYQIPAAGGSPAPVTSLDEARAETNHNWPLFLPDGRHFIFLSRSARLEHDGVTYVGSLDSADRVRLIRADSHAVYAPQGYLLFLQVNTLVAQAFDPATLRLTGEPVPIAEQVERTPGTLRGAFSISRTGVLAYRPIGETRLAWYDRAGRQLQSVGPPGPYSNPALSPDEQQIAVGRLDFDTGASNIWVIDLARGGLASQLTFDASPEEMPLWSPDGSHIVYRSRMSLYQKAATGIGKPEVLPVRGGTALDWFRDDRSLLYYARSPNGEFDLWMLPSTADRTPVGVLRTTFQEGYARLSPDGRWMAYVSDESGRNEVYVRAFPSGDGKRQVSTQGGLEPMWRGDAKEMFYLAPDRSLMSVVVRGGTTFEANPPTRLFETRMSVVSNPSYTRNQYVVSADGQRFLINQPDAGTPLSPITVVVNWQAALKQ